jgi:hypothetical protein
MGINKNSPGDSTVQAAYSTVVTGGHSLQLLVGLPLEQVLQRWNEQEAREQLSTNAFAFEAGICLH